MKKIFVIKILIGTYVGLVNAKRTGVLLNQSDRDSEILSPNYDNEYGIKADCTWKFQLPSPSYALIVTFTNLKMYLWNAGGHWYCPEGYNVTINKRKLKCPIFVNGTSKNPEFCYSYYNSDNCLAINQVTSCKYNEKVESFVDLTYQSDGNESLIQGKLYFRLRYKVKDCQETTSRTSSPTSISSLRVVRNCSKNGNPYLSKTSSVPSETSVPAKTEDNLNVIKGGGNMATIIALVATGAVVAILIIAALLYLKRKKANSSNNQKPAVIYESAQDPPTDCTLTGTTDYCTTSTSHNREARDVYAEIDKRQTSYNDEQAVNKTYELAQEATSSGQSQRQNTHAVADVYASVNKAWSGTKNAMHHEKESVENMLYGATST